MGTINNLDKLRELNERAEAGGGAERARRQHEQGKLLARERLNILLDSGSFVELDRLRTHDCTDFGMEQQKFFGDAVVTGYGAIDSRLVYVYSQDFTVFGGSLSRVVADKICKVMDLALKNGAPIIGINDSGGARIQEGVDSLAGYGEIFQRNVTASGVVPQITAILGPCAGGAVYSPAITDFIFMLKANSYMFITGPDVIKTVTHEEVSKETLGGAETHASRSGVAHFAAGSEKDCLLMIRDLIGFLPGNNQEDPPFRPTSDDPLRRDKRLRSLIPDNPNRPYDMKELITAVVDEGYFYEVQAEFARNILIGFSHVGGRSVGIVANQPAKLLYAYAEATVPKITIVTRKAYGGGYIVMASKHLRGDINLAYPTGEIAVMGPEGAINIVFRDELQKAAEPANAREQLITRYRETFANPFKAAESGYIDGIIYPEETRPTLIRALDLLKNKQDHHPPKKHGNIPL